jgi:peroxiredoxin
MENNEQVAAWVDAQLADTAPAIEIHPDATAGAARWKALRRRRHSIRVTAVLFAAATAALFLFPVPRALAGRCLEACQEYFQPAAIDGNLTMAPEFQLPRADGSMVRLASLRGKVVVLNFWATWCPPCRAEMPSLAALHEELSPKGVVVMGVSMDDGWTAVCPFAATQGIRFPLLLGNTSVAAQYGVSALPETFVIDASGRIARKYQGPIDPDHLSREVRSLLR